jgi:integrase/recombinase XerD
VLKVRGKRGKVVLAPLPPAVGRAIDRAIDDRHGGLILGTRRGWTGTAPPAGCTTSLTKAASTSPGCTPHQRQTFVTTMLDAGVDLRDVQIAARHADPRTTLRYDRARKNLDRTPTTSSPPTCPQGPERSTDEQTSAHPGYAGDPSKIA